VARSTGIVLTVAGITAANEVFFAPAQTGAPKIDFNWRLIPATGALALGLAGLERLAPQFAVGLAWLTLVTALTVRFGNAPTPLENFIHMMGYDK
jgi:hypothetical protein